MANGTIFKRLRGALGMGLTWAVSWGLVGMGIELIHNIWPNPLGRLVDIWPAALAFPAFFGGLVFSTVLGIAGRHRRFDELSLPRMAVWGAVGGVLLGVLPAAMVGVGLAHANVSLWLITGTLSGTGAVVCSISACGTLALARMSEKPDLLEAGDDLNDVGLTNREVQELLGDES